MTAHLIRGDARRLPLAAGSVQCVVTSPPYFGLRSYGGQTSVWGGRDDCDHDWTALRGAKVITGGFTPKQVTNAGSFTAQPRPTAWSAKQWDETYATAAGGFQPAASCSACDAMRVELGSEPDVASFVAHMVEVFRECWRVLRDDGLVFCNIGDGYSGSGKGPTGKNGIGDQAQRQGFKNQASAGRAKSLQLVPERLAIALADDGWVIRSRICWAKAAPMPESVRDRPTTAWEHIWMIAKGPRYYYDADAVREPHAEKSYTVHTTPRKGEGTESAGERFNKWLEDTGKGRVLNPAGANQRNWWLLPPDPYPGAHFATFPREIPRRCILAASREGDVILDPFSGSGTTCFVAASLGRVGVGVELSAEYVAQARYGRLAQDFLPFGVGA